MLLPHLHLTFLLMLPPPLQINMYSQVQLLQAANDIFTAYQTPIVGYNGTRATRDATQLAVPANAKSA